MADMTGKVVALLVLAVLLGALAPTIFQQFAALASNGNLSGTEKAIASVFGIFVAVGFLYGILRASGVKMGN